jgi:hypothetical protein
MQGFLIGVIVERVLAKSEDNGSWVVRERMLRWATEVNARVR